jgi:outer membrane protein OmpA-like peptidoglycan-associated protein
MVTASCTLVGCSAADTRSQSKDVHLESATGYIISAFEQYPLVALSELHGNAESEALFSSLVRDPAFHAQVSDIVVEFGSGLHQDVADRYVAGESVEQETLERIWLDTTQVSGIFSLSMYAEMLAAVRDVNATLAHDKRIRVWLGDPPIDWRVVTGPADEDMNDWRDAYFARIVQDRVRRHDRKALLFIGGGHIARKVIFPNSLIHLLDARLPGETLVVSVLDVGTVTPEVSARLLQWPRGSAGSVRGTWLGQRDVKDVGFRFSTGTVEEDVDALVLLSHEPLTYTPPPPIDPQSPYGIELRRRQRLGLATLPFRGGEIRFAANEATLLPGAEVPLGEVLKELGRGRELKVLVKAFADARERDLNALSAQRAAVVVNWLVQRGISADRLLPRGCGDVRPLTFGETEGDRVRNRRAELVRHTAMAGCEPPW